MAGEAVQGLAELYAMFGTLPEAANEQLGVELAMIGRDILALQQATVPKDTGNLEGQLSLALQLDKLRVRVGLIGIRNKRTGAAFLGKGFYGVIVDKGRAAQTVVVERRRRVNGKLRTARGRKRVEDIVSIYTLNVKAREAVPFVELDQETVDTIATQRLAGFWGQTLDRAGATA